jgi:2-iminoacetate synthase
MSFVAEFNALPLRKLLELSLAATADNIQESLRKTQFSLGDFARLISPAARPALESLCQRAQAVTRRRFGQAIRLFAPLYLSNECVNNCKYCGFSRDNPILRVTLTVDEVAQEARALAGQGFRNILLVAGEHPKFVSSGYLRDCVEAVRPIAPSVGLEIGPLETPDYLPLVEAGADSLVVYQETYDRARYAETHTAGPKRNFDWRLETPERGYAAGFRRLGIGALHGLGDWRAEAICLAAHARYLLRHCWKAMLTISLPRLRPHAGEFEPRARMTDADLTHLVAALRVCFPDVGLVLSTREHPRLRDGLLRVGITLASAGSHTEPGGYTGAGRAHLHYTERGLIRALPMAETAAAPGATEQFSIADARSPEEFAWAIRQSGCEPVWKDWDAALTPP